MAYIEGDFPIYTGNNGYNNNGFGNGWEGLIGLALVASLFGGWGNGFGFNRGGMGGYGTPATQGDLANGFAQNTLQRGIDDIILGQATMQNFINQGFAGLNTTINQSTNTLSQGICNLGYNTASQFAGLSREVADCCCGLKGAIADVKYANEKQTCDIITAINAGNQRLVDIYTNDKIEALRAENVALKGRISNDAQSAYILDRLTPCPKPAFLVPNPNCCYSYGCNGFGTTASIQ